jgi:hypothetical protein
MDRRKESVARPAMIGFSFLRGKREAVSPIFPSAVPSNTGLIPG